MTHQQCQRALRERLEQIVPTEPPLAVGELLAAVNNDPELWRVAGEGPTTDAEFELHELIASYGDPAPIGG